MEELIQTVRHFASHRGVGWEGDEEKDKKKSREEIESCNNHHHATMSENAAPGEMGLLGNENGKDCACLQDNGAHLAFEFKREDILWHDTAGHYCTVGREGVKAGQVDADFGLILSCNGYISHQLSTHMSLHCNAVNVNVVDGHNRNPNSNEYRDHLVGDKLMSMQSPYINVKN